MEELRWRLLEGDCLELLKTLSDDAVSSIVTDPPYGTASKSKVQKHGSQGLQTFDLEWDREVNLQWLEEGARVLKPGGSLLVFTGTSEYFVRQAMQSAGLHVLNNFYWHKVNPPGQPRENFCSAIETGIFAFKPGGKRYWTGGGSTSNVFDAPITGGHERLDHPTQKPLRLTQRLVRLITPLDGLVLDPFAGTGTTMVAAIREGCRAIGIERDPRYCDMIRERMDSVSRPLPGILESGV